MLRHTVYPLLQQKSRVGRSFLLAHAQNLLFTTSSNDSNKNDNEIAAYLASVDIAQDLHAGILKALMQVYGREPKVADLKSLGTAGMQALAASVQQQQQHHHQGAKKRPSTTIHVQVPHHKTQFDLKWRLGESLLDVAKENEDLLGEYLEGTCGGNQSCCTCHVYIDDETFRLLGEPEEAELDMLDLAFDPKETSRLGCQVVLTTDLLSRMQTGRSVTVTIPAGVNNVWQ